MKKGRWVVLLDRSSLKNLLIFLCFSQFHLHFRSPAQRLLEVQVDNDVNNNNNVLLNI